MRCILTAQEMRDAEASCINSGTAVQTLMDRAGSAAAAAIRGYAGPLPTLVICGPGNNGGDGYVIARRLRERGVPVRVAALAEPSGEAATWARRQWDGEVEPLLDAVPASLLVDALFGTGLSRPLEASAAEALGRLAAAASIRAAIDLPSGISTDDGRILSPVPDYDLTISFASLKPAHLLQPAARHIGRLIVADIGVEAVSSLTLIGDPRLPAPGSDDHKYRRGYVAVAGGEMPGAAALAASAALRAGAGYVRLVGSGMVADVPRAIVQGGSWDVADPRLGAVLIGPGLGRTAEASVSLDEYLASPHPLVVDADALFLLRDRLRGVAARTGDTILTPHAGEFEQLFGREGGSKIDRTRAAAVLSGAVVVFKGPDTVVAAPDGRAAIGFPAAAWLASAGTGDVLAGIVAAMRARGMEAFEAASAAVWLHGRAAERAGPGLIADDLIDALRGLAAGGR